MEVDRLSRNIIAYLSWLEDLDQRGVKIVAHSEGLTYADNKLSFIQGVVDAQKEAALLGERVKKSYERKRERGDERVGGLPYGKKYQAVFNEDRSRTIYKMVLDHPEEILNIRRIKNSMSSSGVLANQLNREGVTKRDVGGVRTWCSA